MKQALLLLVLIFTVCCLVGCGSSEEKKTEQVQPAQLQQQEDRAAYASRQKEIDDMQKQFEKNETANRERALSQQRDIVLKLQKQKVFLEKNNAELAKKLAETPVVATNLPKRVNILLIDENNGSISDCFIGVIASEVVKSGKSLHFSINGNPVDWNQRVAMTRPYSVKNASKGAIYNGVAVVVGNVSYEDVYHDDTEGTIYYKVKDGFAIAPKGSGFTTATIVSSPVQQ